MFATLKGWNQRSALRQREQSWTPPFQMSVAEDDELNTSEHFESLFSYGTLQDREVQLSTFGRALVGERDSLPEYSQTSCGPHLNVQFTGQLSDFVEGTRFEVTRTELEEADNYEATADYKRIEVELKSGRRAWVYLNSE